ALGRAGEPGWMSVNEVRKRENMAPDADGDKLFVPDASDNTLEKNTDTGSADKGEQANAQK
ncbi:phage portal protein, partial [Photobacterium frigidiphilum]